MTKSLIDIELPPADGDTWLTPRWLLDALGQFDTDPCAGEARPDWVTGLDGLCFTKEQDGLAHDWQGRVFLNPPYSDVEPWLARLAKHGNGVALLPAGQDTAAWYKYVWGAASAIYFITGRVRFFSPLGNSVNGRTRVPVALASYDKLHSSRMFNMKSLLNVPARGAFIHLWDRRVGDGKRK